MKRGAINLRAIDVLHVEILEHQNRTVRRETVSRDTG